jgi:predicted CoA-substrate-specific enzyme activase
LGAGTTKALVYDGGGRILGTAFVRTRPNLEATAREALQAAREASNLPDGAVEYVATTGYGRYQLPDRDIQITEVTCHARGAKHLFPGTRRVLDIGAQSSRAIRIDDNGRVVRFKMNDRCAAGAGKFLERVSRSLNIALEELPAVALRSQDPQPISSICAVLAESEVINHVSQGKPVEDILMGAHLSIADRVLALLRQVGGEGEVTLTGGLAQNPAMVRALELRLGGPLNHAPESTFAGALGAAVLGQKRLARRLAGGAA